MKNLREMNLRIRLLGVVILLLIYMDSIHCQPLSIPKDKLRLCGTALADVLQKICKDGYNNYSEDSAEVTSNEKKKRGITYECCMHECSFHDLLGYCSNGSSGKNLSNLQEIKIAILHHIPYPNSHNNNDNNIEIINSDNKHVNNNEIKLGNHDNTLNDSYPKTTISPYKQTDTQNFLISQDLGRRVQRRKPSPSDTQVPYVTLSVINKSSN